MRVIEPDDVFPPFPALTLNADQLLRIDVIPVVRRVFPCVSAPGDTRDGLSSIIRKTPEQYPTALMRISFFTVLANGGMIGLRELEHKAKGQIFKVEAAYSSCQNRSVKYFSPESQRMVTMVAR